MYKGDNDPGSSRTELGSAVRMQLAGRGCPLLVFSVSQGLCDHGISHAR